MKKAISVVLALAMVFVLSLSVFAAEKPTEPSDADAWTAYYSELIANAEDPTAVISEILADVTGGAMDPVTALSVIAALVEQGIVENETVQSIIAAIQDLIGGGEDEGDDGEGSGGLGSLLPDFGNLQLPEFNFDGLFDTLGTIFDVVFGALGGIVGMLFGGSGGDDNPTTPDDDDPWGDDGFGDDDFGGSLDGDGFGDDGFNDNSLGDTTVFAVAAVAAVAGVALVLTRKKSKDDDAE